MRDAYTVVFINCGTSIFAGIVVFSILGYRESVTGIPVTKVLMHFIWRWSVWLIFDFLKEEGRKMEPLSESNWKIGVPKCKNITKPE